MTKEERKENSKLVKNLKTWSTITVYLSIGSVMYTKVPKGYILSVDNQTFFIKDKDKKKKKKHHKKSLSYREFQEAVVEANRWKDN